MPHLTPSLLIKRKKRKISPSLLQRQATLADGRAEGYIGGNDFQNTIAPAAKQLQQSWDPEAFREASLHLPVFFVGMRIIHGSFHCKPKLHMFLEQPHQRLNPSLVWTYNDMNVSSTLSTCAQRLVGKYSMISTSRQMLRKFAVTDSNEMGIMMHENTASTRVGRLRSCLMQSCRFGTDAFGSNHGHIRLCHNPPLPNGSDRGLPFSSPLSLDLPLSLALPRLDSAICRACLAFSCMLRRSLLA